jgi:predicted GNAT family acetyltransferase
LSADQLFSRVARERSNLNAADAADQIHVTLSQNQRIIGVSGPQTNPHDSKMLWVQHISVEPQHQGKGYASRLVESVYDYALRRSQKVLPSSFSAQGQRLKHIFDKLDAVYPEAAANVPHADL